MKNRSTYISDSATASKVSLQSRSSENTSAKTSATAVELFSRFVTENPYPCLMAESVFGNGQVQVKDYGSTTGTWTATHLLNDIDDYIKAAEVEGENEYRSFVALFSQEEVASEEAFEALLWEFLEELSDRDEYPWDPTVSSDPADTDFCFSLRSRAFFIIGLHPESSRFARRAPVVAMVFNLHSQFEKLRKRDIYIPIRDMIRKRDKAHQGTVNPMVADHGKSSEARQYSDREVEEHWTCPWSRLQDK